MIKIDCLEHIGYDLYEDVTAHWTSPLGDDLHEYSHNTIYYSCKNYLENDFESTVEKDFKSSIDDSYDHYHTNGVTREEIKDLLLDIVKQHVEGLVETYMDGADSDSDDENEDLKL